MGYTLKQKQEYYKNLRKSWAESKKLAENDKVAQALYRESGMKGISYWSFYFTLTQMRALKYKGLPYIDCKTYGKWLEAGYKIKKGEKSRISGITWVGVKTKGDDGEVDEDSTWIFPKSYHLFHKTQTEAIK